MKTPFAIRVLLLSIALCITPTRCMASDWEEDPTGAGQTKQSQTAAMTMPAPAPEIVRSQNNAPASGAMLQGQATSINTRLPSAQSQAASLGEIARIDAEADSFLARAQVDQIVEPRVFKGFLEAIHPNFSQLKGKETAREITVVRGQWDNSTKPLQAFGLQYGSLKDKQISSATLAGVKVLLIDCAGTVPRESLQAIRDFVAHGGYLISTDWTLNNVLAKAFPGYIKWSGENTDGIITDALVLNSDPTLFKGVTARRYTWKLDRLSQQVRVVNPARVRVLARSSKLARLDVQFRILGNPLLAGALACEFEFGRGKVLHLVGHFDNCANIFRANLLPDPSPDMGISLRQALVVNFIVEGLEREQKQSTNE